MTTRAFFLLFLCLASPFAPAQPLAGDLFLCTPGRVPGGPHMYGGLYHVSPQGKHTTLRLGRSYADLVMDMNNKDLLIATPIDVRIINPFTQATRRTLWNGSPIKYVQCITPLHTGDLLVSSNDSRSPNQVFRLRYDGSAITTIHAGITGTNAYNYLQDLATGDILEASWTGLRTFPLAGSPVTTLHGATIYGITQDHQDGSLILSTPTGLMRLDRVKGLTTIRAGTSHGHLAFDRWVGKGEIVGGVPGSLLRLDGTGRIVATIPCNVAGINVCFGQGRNLVTRRILTARNRWQFTLDFPGEGGRPYVLGLSLSGFTPGIPVDTRVIPLQPDDLLRLTLTGGFTAFLQGNIGLLDAGGNASAVLDVSPLGAAVKGVKIWAAAATLNGPSLSGIGTITRPAVIVLE